MTKLKEIAKEIHASLYSTQLKYQETILGLYYSNHCVFDDPLVLRTYLLFGSLKVSVKGIQAISSQFKALALFSCISCNILSISQTTAVQLDSTATVDIVLIDAIVSFRLAFCRKLKLFLPKYTLYFIRIITFK